MKNVINASPRPNMIDGSNALGIDSPNAIKKMLIMIDVNGIQKSLL